MTAATLPPSKVLGLRARRRQDPNDPLMMVLQDYENALDDLAGYLADLRYQVPRSFAEVEEAIYEEGIDGLLDALENALSEAASVLTEIGELLRDFYQMKGGLSPETLELFEVDLAEIPLYARNLEALAGELTGYVDFVFLLIGL